MSTRMGTKLRYSLNVLHMIQMMLLQCVVLHGVLSPNQYNTRKNTLILNIGNPNKDP